MYGEVERTKNNRFFRRFLCAPKELCITLLGIFMRREDRHCTTFPSSSPHSNSRIALCWYLNTCFFCYC
ncbi:hypothetical protein RB195_021167 [Necator americanus]|uniref:Uncharacterized protein n=1 Tax=Necator americanus TaxID=51031 RepID=A0ABR1EA34_NECAM